MNSPVAVRFCDLGWPIISPLISWHSKSWINHCDLVLNGELISAMPVAGVRRRSIAGFPVRRAEYVELPCTSAQVLRMIGWIGDQIGKPYDYFGTLAFPFRPPWNDAGRWFCSELTAAALHEAGIIQVPIKTCRISPADLYDLCRG